jgi:hypothetical protein
MEPLSTLSGKIWILHVNNVTGALGWSRIHILSAKLAFGFIQDV